MQRETVRKWLKQALHDLKMAERNITIEGYDVAAFLSHQAVEKLLKALFVFQGRKIPKTHYIDELAHNLNLSEEIISCVYGLTADYTLARYPDVSEAVPYEQYDKNLADEKINSAKAVFNLIAESYKELFEEYYNA
jgi:HEPN domain-containing protein